MAAAKTAPVFSNLNILTFLTFPTRFSLDFTITALENSSLPKYSNPYDYTYSVQTPIEAADNLVNNNAPDARLH